MTYGEMIGRRVAAARRQRKMTAGTLAERSGVTRSVIANLENGRKQDVGVGELVAIAKALRVSPVALLVDLTEPFDQDIDGIDNFTAANWFGLWEYRGTGDLMWSLDTEVSLVRKLRALAQNSDRARALSSEWASRILGRNQTELSSQDEQEIAADRDRFIKWRDQLVKDVKSLGAEVPDTFAPIPPLGQTIADAARLAREFRKIDETLADTSHDHEPN